VPNESAPARRQKPPKNAPTTTARAVPSSTLATSATSAADVDRLVARADALLARLLPLVERVDEWMPASSAPDWAGAIAWRWRRRKTALGSVGLLHPVRRPAALAFDDLQNVDEQKALVEQNTRQFVAGKAANNVLLTGARGTGKSSLIKACLNAFHPQGLRLIEVDKDDLVDLPEIVDRVADRPERFIVYCDDLSFEHGEGGYKALKTVLDGSVSGQADNVLVYATSNRRHLMPEFMSENLEAKYQEDGEIHPGETSEEKISLSERFGLWVAFYPFRQDDYLAVVGHWLGWFGASPADIERARGDALRWALERGSRSGRVGWQFARDWSGRHVRRGAPRKGRA
jgi:predicted AAA+ superfamily ATPase